MGSTTIDVLVFSGDYGCCGTPFAVGDELAFTLGAPTPPIVGAEGRATYFDDRHPMDEEGMREVRGRVEAIVAVHERMVPVAGAHHLINDPDDTIEREADRVPTVDEPDGYCLVHYRVRFRIPAETELPAPRAARAVRPETPCPLSGPTHVLTSLVEEVAERFGADVDILRAHDDRAVTIAPRREDAAAVRWNLSDGELVVEIERAEWTLPWDDAGLAALRGLLDAAASGGFAEWVEGEKFVAAATTPEGFTFSAVAPAPALPPGGGFVVMPASTGERLARARSGRPYPSWS